MVGLEDLVAMAPLSLCMGAGSRHLAAMEKL